MSKPPKPPSLSQIQLDELLKDLETEEGRKRIGDDAYKEAMAAKRRGSIDPGSSKN